MSIHVALNHKTDYRYDRLITLGPQLVRLRPAPHCRTPILSYSMRVEPAKHFVNWQQDPHSNLIARLVFPEKVRQLSIEVDLVADMTVINPFDFFLEPYAEKFPFEYESSLLGDLTPYLVTEKPGPVLTRYLKGIDRSRKQATQFLFDLNHELQQRIDYVIRMEPGVQTCEQTLTKKSGSCRDSAWLLVQILRNLGLAARFASGYLIQLKPDVKSLDGPSGAETDFTDLHAWTEVYLPGAGWVGLDPTSGLFAGEGHIPLACSPHPTSAAPITGELDDCETEFRHSMSVARIRETPRVTLPYTDAQWQHIQAVGHKVDQLLEHGDVRLTMGGEPTFVSIDDMEGAEWNTEAMGLNKRRLAEDLLVRLEKRWASGALRHFGQGKWYPGEQLPRWALGCYWRRDGEPIWTRPELFATADTRYDADTKLARRLGSILTERLELPEKFLVPAFEDVFYYLWRERRLPENVDPLESKLDDPQERARLARVFEEGLGKVRGYALPIDRAFWDGAGKWVSGPWFFRNERMYLLPGDSPMGFRLPLDSLPWAHEKDLPGFHGHDPMGERPPLPGRASPWRVARAGGEEGGRPGISEQHLSPDRPAKGESAHWVVRTALCIEPREGKLHLFMPPTRTAEDYLDLVAAIEDAVAEFGKPVVIEGYAPPHDPRLCELKVTPDPGVIEVNVPPVKDWDGLVTQVSDLYEEARLTRLGTEKFMLDGRHTGTGGGNHVVAGAGLPADSPFLRRPQLLRSLLGYWHNHPSLSYLFSGLFIGPTSQAPRVDEGRRDASYELEIAFKEVDESAGPMPLWMVDRVFRHLLVDVTGNTHRAEFCIDKLYSPDSATGRLGLLEFRGFEMPPHPQMSLAQQLLMRALIAKFWDKPYREALEPWDTTLHDRFLLPHFVQEDFGDVLTDLRDAGCDLRLDHFAPHFEFRFPRIGSITQRGVEVELRTAIEPWYVLGEEPAGGGTTRFVDSSVERLQVRARGLSGTRYVVTCNGHRVPLHPTGAEQEYVAGVRYRAWQPPSCLHPSIPVHTPLTFDILDTWSRRSIGGCTYHVAHPAGRNYEMFPVNAYEAEARRRARFLPFGHTPGDHREAPEASRDPHFPLTLDLRKV